MGSRRRNLFVLLFVIGLTIASVLVILNKESKLGLDLRGGTELIYEGQPTPQNPDVDLEDLDRAIEIIRKRIDSLGVSEPEIATVGETQISIGLPDVQDVKEATDRIGTTAQLYFYDWQGNVIGRPGANDPAEQGFSRLYDAVEFASKQKGLSDDECIDVCTFKGERYYLFEEDTLKPLVQAPTQTEKDLYAEFDGEQPAGSVVRSIPQGVVVVCEPPIDNPDTDVDEGEACNPPEPGSTEPDIAGEEFFVLEDRPALSGDEIVNPEQNFEPNTNQPNVTFDFTDEGQEAFADVTREIAERGRAEAPIGIADAEQAAAASHNFAVVLDNEVVTRPIINFVENPAGIDGRTGAQISGSFTLDEAQVLAENLRIGALPVELKLISQSTVSATLGEEALDQGLKAGLIGLALVLLFLIAYYRLLGVVAALGLLIYAVFFYALIELIPITLTLPGIAGLILTIGVAADSNVVIFERIKEEFRAGRSMPSAIATGYRKGIGTIVDANVITLITAFILFVLATSGVKGFAFTLGVGTIVSLLTAVVFTQAILGTFGRARFLRSPGLLGASEQRVRWHFDFTGASRWFFSISGMILVVGALALATNQLNLGIDFESGTRITVSFDEPATVEEVRTALTDGGIDEATNAEIVETQSDVLGENAFTISSESPSEDANQAGLIQNALDREFGVATFDSTEVGASFGEQVARSAVYAVLFSLLVIAAYVAIRFEPKYAIPVIIALIHDVLITAGVYSLADREVTSATVAAFLTILGYSMYDTVIVFDRIRENVPRLPRATFSQIVNRSMSEVLTRSLITGLSTVFLIGVLLIFGGDTLKDFAFAMMIGVASGTYSSIFIAAPVLTAWKEREPQYRNRRAQIEHSMGYVPPFPEENVVERVEDARGEPVPELPADEEAEAAPAAAPTAVATMPDALPDGDSGDGADGQPEPEEPVVARGGNGAQTPEPKPPPKPRRQQQRRRRKHGRRR